MKSNEFLVTIIIPSYNHEKYVEQSILSALNQTYKNIEIIIIDDGSSDATPEIIESIVSAYNGEKSLRLFRQENQGLTKTLNRAVNLASGEFITFLASDDAYLPTRIQDTVSRLLEEPETTAAVYSDGLLIDDKGNRTAKFSSKYLRPIGKDTYKELLIANWIPAMGVTYRKKALIDVGLFDEELKIEDYDLLIKLSQKYHIAYINKPLFLYRIHGLNFTKNKSEFTDSISKIQKKYKDLSSFTSFLSAIRNIEIFEILKITNLSNVELLFRLIVRKIQIRTSLQGFSYCGLSIALSKKFLGRMIDSARCMFHRLRGLCIGKGSRVKGKIKIVGNKSNISIGSNVHILGDIKIVTEYSKIPSQIIISDNCVIDDGAILFSLGGTIELGKKCFVGSYTTIQANGDVVVGDYTMIAANSSIYANNHITDSIKIPYWEQGNRFEGIEIGRNCWIGTNVVVLDGAKLGDNCIVGASCIVIGEHKSNSRILAKQVVGKIV
jgi:glycosyltransferase involved in cell wall biosynthesis/carbonic anhydrase/acetyltransferase-like protein (isoleucine patch superfamily)